MSGLSDWLKKWLPPISDESRVTDYFQTAYQLEHQNVTLYDELIPLIRYEFLREMAEALRSSQQQDCQQIIIELASNQVKKPEQSPSGDRPDLPTDYHRRTHLLNQLLENNKSLAALYLHLSYAETIALNSQYEKLKAAKETQIKVLQDISIRLN